MPKEVSRGFITTSNWEVTNTITGKRMLIRKGQLVFKQAVCREVHSVGFSTMDGRTFFSSEYNGDICLLRPIFFNGPLMWSYRV